MTSLKPNQERIKQRREEVMRAALRARKFTEEELTRETANFIKFAYSLKKIEIQGKSEEGKEMTIDPITESLKRLVKYFNSRKIPYVVVGGVSVFVLGRTRFTLDVDIILDHTKLNREDFIDYLRNDNFDASLTDFEGFDENSHCSFLYKTGMFRIDIKGAYSELELESIKMAIDGIYNDIKLKINNPVNLILYKLQFGSEQDYEDAFAVYIRNKERIDTNFLKDKARKMNIENQLNLFLIDITEFLNKEGVK